MFYKSLIKFGNVFWVIQITQIKEFEGWILKIYYWKELKIYALGDHTNINLESRS